MAWTWNGLAKADVVSATEILASPFLIKKFNIVADGATAEEALHGEAYAPDMILVMSTDGTPAAAISTQTPTTAATQVKFDVEAAENFTAYLIWFAQSSGGISS